MVLTEQELHPRIVLPFVEDRETAARVSSLICFIAAAWFFVSPWAFFGVSEQSSGWNAWLIGGLMTAFSIFRLIAPRASVPFTWIQMLLGAWVICSPFVYGYVDDTARLANSIGCGACVLGFTLMSRVHSVRLRIPRNMASESDDLV
jgi:hypothetical protein